MTITVNIDKAPSTNLTIPVNVSPGNDQNIIIGAGNSSGSFSYSGSQDSRLRRRDQVRLSFGTLPSGIIRGSPSTSTIDIDDDDDDCEISFPGSIAISGLRRHHFDRGIATPSRCLRPALTTTPPTQSG